MNVEFAKVAKLLASQARSAMLGALLDGRAMTAGELARAAAVRPATASEHLGELVKGGLVTVSSQGRHRYFALAGTDVAEALEAFSRICPSTPARSLRASAEARALSFARTCYDHLAGLLGVLVLDAFLAKRWLIAGEAAYTVSPPGYAGFTELGVDVVALQRQRRSLARPCLDWTARRPHLAGGLGAAVTASLLERRWIEREPRRRALRLTPAGDMRLRELLGIEADIGDAPAGPAGLAGHTQASAPI
jgi:DNA-binding transcriptional ArsR family regulator